MRDSKRTQDRKNSYAAQRITEMLDGVGENIDDVVDFAVGKRRKR